jgi:DNA replication and repair protein RecF
VTISRLSIQHFRILSAVDIETSPHFTIFYGNNGSGKTSLLEAIHYLATAKSFRTSQSERIVQHQHEQFSIVAKMVESSRPLEIDTVGIERGIGGLRRIRMNGQPQTQLAPLAKKLPTLLISTESYRFFHDGPKSRRQLLDWGLFHVEHSFHEIWKEFQSSLQQRNAAIKSKSPRTLISAWDEGLAIAAEKINAMRQAYVDRLQPILAGLLKSLLRESELELIYLPGWDTSKDLQTQLQSSLFKDMMMGYTQLGPQRADLSVRFHGIPVEDYLSQGQQKLAAYAVKLAQGILMAELASIRPIYLIDDLPSELDPTRKEFIIEALKNLNAQVFITSILKNDLENLVNAKETKLFHVEHGVVSLCETSESVLT